MAEKLGDRVTQELLAAIRTSPEGIGIEALSKQFGGQISRRSLQRHLSGLVMRGELLAEKSARATRYRLPAAQVQTETEDVLVPLSPSGADVWRLVRKPLAERAPVGYNRKFLEDYRPNVTAYLTVETTSHLARLGQTPDAARPAGTYARQILDRLLVDLSWASSRLEGNTYSRLDTKRLIEEGHAAEGKDAAETQMILNHKAAIEFMVESAEELNLNRQTILNLHALLSDNLLPDFTASGRLRQIGVGIHHSVYHPLETPQVIEEYFERLISTAAAIRDPFEQAFFIMAHLPYLQPFEDVNKRVSRLAANIPLIRHNLCPLSFIDVPQGAYVDGLLAIYELNRVELLRDVFIWAYERSCQRYAAIRQSLGEPDRFRLRFRNELTSVIAEIVRGLRPPSVESVAALSAGIVPPENLDDFVRIAIGELENLHEGNYARFRVRPSEFQAWSEARGQGQ